MPNLSPDDVKLLLGQLGFNGPTPNDIKIDGPENSVFEISKSNYIGSGSFNWVFESTDKKWVIKIMIPPATRMDAPERLVRLVDKRLNPQIITFNNKQFFVMRKCEYEEVASDEEIAQEIIRDFIETGRVCVDGFSSGNYIKLSADCGGSLKAGDIVSVDAGMRLLLLKNSNKTSENTGLPFNKSKDSLDTWEKNVEDVDRHDPYRDRIRGTLNNLAKKYCYYYNAKTIEAIKALIFFSENFPQLWIDYRNTAGLEQLQSNATLIQQLAIAYDLLPDKYLPITDFSETTQKIDESFLKKLTKINRDYFFDIKKDLFESRDEIDTLCKDSRVESALYTLYEVGDLNKPTLSVLQSCRIDVIESRLLVLRNLNFLGIVSVDLNNIDEQKARKLFTQNEQGPFNSFLVLLFTNHCLVEYVTYLCEKYNTAESIKKYFLELKNLQYPDLVGSVLYLALMDDEAENNFVSQVTCWQALNYNQIFTYGEEDKTFVEIVAIEQRWVLLGKMLESFKRNSTLAEKTAVEKILRAILNEIAFEKIIESDYPHVSVILQICKNVSFSTLITAYNLEQRKAVLSFFMHTNFHLSEQDIFECWKKMVSTDALFSRKFFDCYLHAIDSNKKPYLLNRVQGYIEQLIINAYSNNKKDDVVRLLDNYRDVLSLNKDDDYQKAIDILIESSKKPPLSDIPFLSDKDIKIYKDKNTYYPIAENIKQTAIKLDQNSSALIFLTRTTETKNAKYEPENKRRKQWQIKRLKHFFEKANEIIKSEIAIADKTIRSAKNTSVQEIKIHKKSYKFSHKLLVKMWDDFLMNPVSPEVYIKNIRKILIEDDADAPEGLKSLFYSRYGKKESIDIEQFGRILADSCVQKKQGFFGHFLGAHNSIEPNSPEYRHLKALHAHAHKKNATTVSYDDVHFAIFTASRDWFNWGVSKRVELFRAVSKNEKTKLDKSHDERTDKLIKSLRDMFNQQDRELASRVVHEVDVSENNFHDYNTSAYKKNSGSVFGL